MVAHGASPNYNELIYVYMYQPSRLPSLPKHISYFIRFNALKVELSNALARLNTSESRLIALQEETDYEYRKLLKVEYKGNCLDKRADYFEDEIERVEQKYYTALQVEDENVVLAKELTIERDRIRCKYIIIC